MTMDILIFKYLNHRGSTDMREVLFESVQYIREPGYGYEPGWFISGYDLHRKARRSFALANIIFDDPPQAIHTLMDRTYPKAELIFVFGSNLAGRHGAGAAKFALERKGAKYGQGIGLQGNSYAIPTKNRQIRTLEPHVIKEHVEDFISLASTMNMLQFQVTRVGCGLAGLSDHDMAGMFLTAPLNCLFDEAWKPFFEDKGKEARYWGTF
jgi:hypothetical protein